MDFIKVNNRNISDDLEDLLLLKKISTRAGNLALDEFEDRINHIAFNKDRFVGRFKEKIKVLGVDPKVTDTVYYLVSLSPSESLTNKSAKRFLEVEY